MAWSDLLKAWVESTRTMTSVGPNNARAYTQILGGAAQAVQNMAAATKEAAAAAKEVREPRGARRAPGFYGEASWPRPEMGVAPTTGRLRGAHRAARYFGEESWTGAGRNQAIAAEVLEPIVAQVVPEGMAAILQRLLRGRAGGAAASTAAGAAGGGAAAGTAATTAARLLGLLGGPVALVAIAAQVAARLTNRVDAAAARVKAPESWDEFQKGVEEGVPNAYRRLGGPIAGPVASAATRLTIALAKAPFQLDRFATSVLKASERLREFSPAINQVFARLQWQERFLAARRAMATEGSARAAGESLYRLREETAPTEQGFTSLKNVAAMIGAEIGRALLRGSALAFLARQIGEKAERLLGGGARERVENAFLDHLANLANPNIARFGQPRNQRPEVYGEADAARWRRGGR